MTNRIPLDRLKHVARSGLEVGKVAGAHATRLAAAGVTRAVETADAWRERRGRSAATPTTGPEPAGPAPAAAPETPPGRAPAGKAPEAEPEAPAGPTPTDVAKVVERKPAAEKASSIPAAPQGSSGKPAKKSAPGAKLPPRRQADA